MVSMVDEFGYKHHDHAGIAEVFVASYQNLYTGRKIEDGPLVKSQEISFGTFYHRGVCRNVEGSLRDAAGCDPGSVQ